MRSQLAAVICGSFLLFGSAAAFAQETPVEPREYSLLGKTLVGMAISAGAGASNFTADSTRDATDVGAAWNAKMTIGTHSLVGTEITYLGSAQGVNALGLDSDANLVSNGITGALRVNFTDAMLQPYLLAGVGWRYYNVAADTNLSSVRDNDNIFEIPVGAGLAMRVAGLIVDGRFEFHKTFEEELFAGTDQSMDNWVAGANVGWEF
jgi:hypothetical protein